MRYLLLCLLVFFWAVCGGLVSGWHIVQHLKERDEELYTGGKDKRK